MQSRNRTVSIAALTLLAIVCHAAMGADASDGDATALAISVDANGEDTASIPDFDGDGTIGFGDFVIFAGVFGARQGDAKYDATYDLNGDGEIGFSDFVIFAQNFGRDAPSPVVAIPDANLRAAIAAALGKVIGAPITVDDMETLTWLKVDFDAGISDLTGLEYATNLENLWLENNSITDISPLSGLTNLTVLSLWNNSIMGNISSLSGLTNLTQLQLGSNAIEDISSLSNLANLTELWLWNNQIEDISPLSGLTNLTRLGLDQNDIGDISALAGLTNLERLILAYNNIEDISALSGLTNLAGLDLFLNKVADISPLRGLTNLAELDIQWNPLNDSSLNDHIPALENRGVTVMVTPSSKGDFDIELVFSDAFTEDQKDLLRLVARRWMSVITGDLPDYEFAQGWSGMCGDQSYEIPAGERIDDMRIYMTTFEGGNAVGWGGPRLVRDETHLPVLGCMGFDLERANLLITGLHEVGHVLGFGPVWDDLGLIQDLSRDDPNADTHFNGPLAIAAFDEAGGRDYAGRKVPVEKMDGAHWRYAALPGELMGPRGGPALSAITVQSIADLGYGVDVTLADAYTLPGAAGKASAKIAVSTPSILGDDQTWQFEGAERILGRRVTFDLPDNQRTWGGGSPSHAEPDLTCGAGQMNEPIYVVDPQGRIVRTINR